MARIRLNRGGLYPTGKPKRAGFKDSHYEFMCNTCDGKILKKESNIIIPTKDGVERFHFKKACQPGGVK